MPRLFTINGEEMIYQYCTECMRWNNWRVCKRVGQSALRIECKGCGARRVIADPTATVR